MAFPADSPIWATSNTYSDGVTPNKLRPIEPLRTYGYEPNSAPTAQELNWQLNNLYLQIQELKTLSASAFQTPVGRLIFIDGDNRNPAIIYGYGTWIPFGQGRVIIGSGTGTDVNGVPKTFPAGSSGGEYQHSISGSELPAHTHQYKDRYLFETGTVMSGVPEGKKERVGFINGGFGTGAYNFDNDTFVFEDSVTAPTGGNQAMNLLPTYQTINIWKRTA